MRVKVWVNNSFKIFKSFDSCMMQSSAQKTNFALTLREKLNLVPLDKVLVTKVVLTEYQ